eukprot:TRINITY_DN7535_c0_g1_i4.p2 TRINITY_DN7535_c0_g1~~TRINITY_DN7535_c0_g1_i4.p2  ORF type:complete len:103 (+),score=37.01 TRINITY_DN7535_c0_g1_i4:104-412(+)
MSEQEKWNTTLDKLQISKTDMNKLVLNFLSLEGYKEAAERFMRETGLGLDEEEKYVLRERKEIRELIQNDSIEEAIDRINSLCPEVSFGVSVVAGGKRRAEL